MTTIQMQYFLQAASLLNFTAAAEKLYISQPSLSQQISNIENELETKLFIRGNNTLRLTPAGQVLYEGIKQIYGDYERLLTQMKNVSMGISGELNIGLLEDQLLNDVLISAIHRFKETHPNVNLNISRKDLKSLHDGISDGSIDIAVTFLYYEQHTKDILFREISHEKHYLAISKKNGERLPDKLTFEEYKTVLKTYPLILITQDNFETPIKDSLNEPIYEIQRNGSHPVSMVATASAVPLHVVSGLGVAITNTTHILSIDPNVRFIELDLSDSEMELWKRVFSKGILWKRLNANPVIQEFIDVFDELLKCENST